jgi:hypothetical protein
MAYGNVIGKISGSQQDLSVRKHFHLHKLKAGISDLPLHVAIRYWPYAFKPITNANQILKGTGTNVSAKTRMQSHAIT